MRDSGNDDDGKWREREKKKMNDSDYGKMIESMIVMGNGSGVKALALFSFLLCKLHNKSNSLNLHIIYVYMFATKVFTWNSSFLNFLIWFASGWVRFYMNVCMPCNVVNDNLHVKY